MRTNQTGWTMVAVVIVATLTSTRVSAADAAATATTSTSTRRVIVSLPDRKLAVVEDSQILALFDVAVGKPSSPSPIGTFTIINRLQHPTYYHPGKVIPPGANNPLGTRWMGLSQKGYGIHGTDNPSSIGYAQSSGCIRLRNADVERLFEHVREGDVVELHAELTPEIAQIFADAQ